MRRILEWLGILKRREGILSRLCREVPEFRALSEIDPSQGKVAAALAILRGRIPHVIGPDVSPEDLTALVSAGEILDLADKRRLLVGMAHPQTITDEIDGGQASCDQWAEQAVREAQRGLEAAWRAGGGIPR